jgi:hypothetical protein
MADSPNENASEWEQIGDPASFNPIEQRKQSLRQPHSEGSNNVRYATAGGMALFVLAFALWGITSPPQAPVKPTRAGQTGRTVDEQLAFEAGQSVGREFGIIGGIWLCCLLCALALRSARLGPRATHPAPARLAMYFAPAAVASIGGALLLFVGRDPLGVKASGAMRVAGALTLILGAVLLAWAVTKPVQPALPRKP